MKFLLALVLTLSSFAHAQVEPEDDELMRALQNLNGRAMVIDQSDRAVWQEKAGRIFAIAAVFAAVVAGANRQYFKRVRTSDAELFILDGALAAMVGSAAVWTGAEWMRRNERAPEALEAAQYLNSADAMNDFFRLPTDQQYLIARQDQNLREFIVTMARAHDFTDKRTPEEAGLVNQNR